MVEDYDFIIHNLYIYMYNEVSCKYMHFGSLLALVFCYITVSFSERATIVLLLGN